MNHNALNLLAQTANETTHLTAGGAAVMAISVGLVLGLAVFCMSRILGESRPTAQHRRPLGLDDARRHPRLDRIVVGVEKLRGLGQGAARSAVQLGRRLGRIGR